MAQLFSDAEVAEDEIQNVIARRGTGKSIEGLENFVQVEKNHLMGDGCAGCLTCATKRCYCRRNRLLLAEIREQRSFSAGRLAGEKREDGVA
jgi:hypothetical protein